MESYDLVIDCGNSATKVYVVEDNAIVESHRFATATAGELNAVAAHRSFGNCIVASVGTLGDDAREWLSAEVDNLITLDSTTPMPLSIDYDTPSTLGADRIAAAVGAIELAPECPVAVIDAGTAITCDFVDADGCFRGGNISPGIALRFKALHDHTGKLPIVDADGATLLLGRDTVTAIRSGVVNGAAYEIDATISMLKARHDNLAAVITGGDAATIAPRLTNGVIIDRDLVAKGLIAILRYNTTKQ